MRTVSMRVRSLHFISSLFLSSLFLSFILYADYAFANPVIPVPTQPMQPSFTPNAPNLDASGFILMDAISGKVLAQKDADRRMPPASLTKLMTMYIVSSAIKNGHIRLDDKVR